MYATRVDLPRLFLPRQKFRSCQRSVVAKNTACIPGWSRTGHKADAAPLKFKGMSTGQACDQVLRMCLCDTAAIATDKRLLYGKRQGITQPASGSNIPISRAKSIQRGGVRCAQDDSHWRTP